MAFIPEIEKKTLEEQQQFQCIRLKETLHYLQQHSPFYNSLFTRHGVGPENINTLDDLRFFPTTSKTDIQEHNWDFLCVPREQVKEYTATSGTMGTPVFIALTGKDQERLAYNEYLSFQSMEAGPEDVFQLMLTLDRQFMAGTAYYSGLGRVGAAAVRTGPGLPAMQWDIIKQLGSTGLVAVPSFLIKMTEYARMNGIDPDKTTVKKVLAIGETLRDEHFMPNALARKIGEQWKVALYGTYASTEMQTAFTECSAGRGGHHHPELIIAEIIDDNGNPVPHGEKGEVTITTLGVEAMPLLRYRTGDICRAYYDPCSCGRTTMRLGPVLGRKQQMIKFKGTTLYPPVIFDVLNEAEAIREYVVDLRTGEDGQDELRLYIHSPLSHAACDELIKPLFRHKWRVTPEVMYLSASEILKLQFPDQNRKPVRFRDFR